MYFILVVTKIKVGLQMSCIVGALTVKTNLRPSATKELNIKKHNTSFKIKFKLLLWNRI